MERTSGVVVGYDGSGRALSALRWAAREAAHRGLPLRVIRIIPYAASPDRGPGSGPEDHVTEDHATNHPGAERDHVLQEGIRQARTLLDEGQVSGVCIAGHPAAVLAEASGQAALLVVGQRSQDAPVSSGADSTSLVLADHAHCPVVVARGAAGPERAALAVVVGVPVVLGTTADATSRATLDFAAYAAQIRGVPLTVVVAWSLPPARELARGTTGFETMAQWGRALSARATAVADASGDHVRQHYPDVVTQVQVEQRQAVTALEHASRRAGLLVLGGGMGTGSPSSAGSLAQEWGQVVREVLGRAACPTVVVPEH